MKTILKLRLLNLIPYFGLMILVLLVLARANPYTTIPSRDANMFLYAGRLITQGAIPYIDFWDHKPPAIFYLNALGLLIGRDTRWGIFLLEFIFLFTSACLGYKLLQKAWGTGSAVVGMIFWVLALDRVFWLGNSVEEYCLPFNFAAIYLFFLGSQRPEKRIYDFLIGIMALASFLFRANNIGVEIAIGFTWLCLGIFHRHYLLMFKRLGAILAGGLAGLALVVLFLSTQGILIETWNAAILYNFAYAKGQLRILSSIFQGFEYLGINSWMILLGYGASIYIFIRNIKTHIVQPLILFLVVAVPVEFLLASISGRGYRHYYLTWLPVIALLIGALYQFSDNHLFSKRLISFVNSGKIPMLVATLVIMVTMYGRVADYFRSFYVIFFDRGQGVEGISTVSSYILNHTNPKDTVLDWGLSGVNYMTRRDAPTAYIFYPMFIPSNVSSSLGYGFFQDLLANPPELIVDAYIVNPDNVISLDKQIRHGQITSGKCLDSSRVPYVDQVLQFIEDHYIKETEVEGFDIYRLQVP